MGTVGYSGGTVNEDGPEDGPKGKLVGPQGLAHVPLLSIVSGALVCLLPSQRLPSEADLGD